MRRAVFAVDSSAWSLIGVTGVPLIVLIVAAFIGKKAMDASADRLSRKFDATLSKLQADHDSELRKAEARWTHALELQSTIDLDLRAKREAHYLVLWRLGAALPLWPRNRALTGADLVELTTTVRNWYFEGGGMYLSEASRGKYGALQETLHSVVEGHQLGELSDAEYDRARSSFSALRTELTADLLSRSRQVAAA